MKNCAAIYALAKSPEGYKIVKVLETATSWTDYRIAVRCEKHATRYEIFARALKGTNRGCPICKAEMHAEMGQKRKALWEAKGHPKTMGFEEIAKRCEERFRGEITLLSKPTHWTSSVKAKHTCGHTWTTKVGSLLVSDTACPKCANQKRGLPMKSRKEYNAQLREIYGSKFTCLEYLGHAKRSQHRCNDCGENFSRSPSSMLYQNLLCPHCDSRRGAYSRIACNWLKKLEAKLGVPLDGAHRDGERTLRVAGKNLRVDGFCAESLTVYEFLGDDWHGNPEGARKHPKSGKNPAEVLFESMSRLMAISAAGYKVVYVWERDFRRGHLVSGRLASRRKRK